MKKIVFIITVSLICLKINAQKDTLQLIQAYNNFNDYEKTEWTSFMNDWNFFEYSGLLKSQNTKLSCKTCTEFFADVYVEIDAKGNVKKAVFKSGKQCGKSLTDVAIKEWFVKSIKKRKFVSVSNKKFIARFGQALKC